MIPSTTASKLKHFKMALKLEEGDLCCIINVELSQTATVVKLKSGGFQNKIKIGAGQGSNLYLISLLVSGNTVIRVDASCPNSLKMIPTGTDTKKKEIKGYLKI